MTGQCWIVVVCAVVLCVAVLWSVVLVVTVGVEVSPLDKPVEPAESPLCELVVVAAAVGSVVLAVCAVVLDAAVEDGVVTCAVPLDEPVYVGFALLTEDPVVVAGVVCVAVPPEAVPAEAVPAEAVVADPVVCAAPVVAAVGVGAEACDPAIDADVSGALVVVMCDWLALACPAGWLAEPVMEPEPAAPGAGLAPAVPVGVAGDVPDPVCPPVVLAVGAEPSSAFTFPAVCELWPVLVLPRSALGADAVVGVLEPCTGPD